MVEDIALSLVALLVAALSLYKADQQLVFFLEGKLFKAGRDTAAAKLVYRKYTKVWAIVALGSGAVSGAISIGLYMRGSVALTGVAVFAGVLLIGAGIWSRLASFNAADQELSRDVGDVAEDAKRARAP